MFTMCLSAAEGENLITCLAGTLIGCLVEGLNLVIALDWRGRNVPNELPTCTAVPFATELVIANSVALIMLSANTLLVSVASAT